MISYKEAPDLQEDLKKLLHPTVRNWFFSRFESFSLPQLYGVSEIHSRNNILVSAPTGATKTLTGFLSILNELVDSAEKGILEDKIYAVYVSPLKALNQDISVNLKTPLEEINQIAGRDLGIRVSVRTGDTTIKEKANMLKTPPHILITTPESLAIILASPKFREHLKSVDWCILDEIHAIADNKRGVHLSLLLEDLDQMSPHLCRVGLSATVAPLEEIAKYLVGPKRDCKIVDVQFIKQLDLKVLSPVPDFVNTTYENLHEKMYELVDNLIQAHKTTLIFTNTRSATERIVHYMKRKYPEKYSENIGAHHGSLSKEHRQDIEQRLREGKLKCVVCSTSLELGIDIGFIDLVIMLSSPKSVARALQRVGRSGHQLHSITKGRLIVMDRDDLVECSVLLKAAVEKKIDRVHIPTNCLDVLAQVIVGMTINDYWDLDKLYGVIKKSYCYSKLKRHDFDQIVEYLAGKFISLEDRHVYARIWLKDNKIGRRGKLGRVIYMTNLGTIPDESHVLVKINTQLVGYIDEGFLEKLKSGDVFILGGNTYKFKYARGMVAQVTASPGHPPTVPSWFSEMLPLSFDLAQEIGKFRHHMEQLLKKGASKTEILKFIDEYLYVDKVSAQAIYNYFFDQFNYCNHIPNYKKIIVEHYSGEDGNMVIFHSLFGRRVNDVLSRAIAFAISRTQHRDAEVAISDNGFYISCPKKVHVMMAFKLLKSKKLIELMNLAIRDSEVLKRRFRHCATRSFMILRNYMGRTKYVGKQQVSSMILLSAVRRISEDFPILSEAKREVLEDLMDIENAEKVLKDIEDNKIKIVEINTQLPSPFAFNLALQGRLDVLKMEDRMDFLKRVHNMVQAKIQLDKGKKN